MTHSDVSSSPTSTSRAWPVMRNYFHCCQTTGRKSYVLDGVFVLCACAIFPPSLSPPLPKEGGATYPSLRLVTLQWFCLDSLPQASQPLGQEWERENQGALTAEWCPCRSILSRDPIIHLLSCFHFLVTASRKDRVESGLFLVEVAGSQSRINRKLVAELGWCPKVKACFGKRCLPYLMPLLL